MLNDGLLVVVVCLGDIEDWVGDHSNKASIETKPGVTFLLVEGLAFNL